MTILIVDDNANMRAMIRSMFTGRRDVCHECSDGTSALDQYERCHPDIVLMDVAMNPMDGLTATRLMKEGHPEAKVVVVTECGDRRTHDAALEAGADGFVRKEDLITVPEVVASIVRGAH